MILEENRYVFLFQKSDDISGDLSQGIGFREYEIYYIGVKGYSFAQCNIKKLI